VGTCSLKTKGGKKNYTNGDHRADPSNWRSLPSLNKGGPGEKSTKEVEKIGSASEIQTIGVKSIEGGTRFIRK